MSYSELDKKAALVAWLSDVTGLPFFDETTVPNLTDNPQLKQFGTYEGVDDNYEYTVPMAINIWFMNTTSWAEINQVEFSLTSSLGKSVRIPCKGGSLWIMRGHPFSRNYGGELNSVPVVRKYMNLYVKYETLN